MQFAILKCAFAVSLIASITLVSAGADAAPISASGGFDYYAGVGDETTRSVVGVVGAGLGGASVAIGALRYDNNVIGAGTGFIAAAGYPLAPLTSLRAQVIRYMGEDDYQAWRVRVGPEFSVLSGATFGLFYTRYDDGVADLSHGAVAEVAAPLVPTVTPRMTASWTTSGGESAVQMAAGLGWSPIRGLEITTEAGLAQNTTAGAGAFPSQRSRTLPLLGGDPTPSSPDETKFEPTALVGLRIAFP